MKVTTQTAPLVQTMREYLLERADATEYVYEREPFDKNMIQIIGHTQIYPKEILVWENIRLIDNRNLHLLKDGKIENYV
jgi:hypothetical protein